MTVTHPFKRAVQSRLSVICASIRRWLEPSSAELPRVGSSSRTPSHLLFESLENRLLLSAAPPFLPVLDGAAPPVSPPSAGLGTGPQAATPQIQIPASDAGRASQATMQPDPSADATSGAASTTVILLPATQDSVVKPTQGPGATSAQWIQVDLDGARHVEYDGPVHVGDIDVAAFQAPERLQGSEGLIEASMMDALSQTYAGMGVTFSMAPAPNHAEQSTIYVGGNGAAFAKYGDYLGLSEEVDTGNRDHTDKAFVFSDKLDSSGLDAKSYGQMLAGYVAHEAGHLLGFEHAHPVANDPDPLAAVAYKPYTHVEIARDVLADLLANNGQVTLDGKEYQVNPQIVAAIEKYPGYYYGGASGDAFPDLAMAQTNLHPDSTGLWVSHVLDMAWKVQNDDSYSPEEKLQSLAFAYGFATHAAGDVWAHTLINTLDGGIWPDLGDVVSNEQALANPIRHILIEAYIADATPGYDGINEVGPITPGLGPSLDEIQRTRLPTGDVSNLSTPTVEIKAPLRFLYDAFIYNVPDLPGQLEGNGQTDGTGKPLFTVAETSAGPADDPTTVDFWKTQFLKAYDPSNTASAIPLADTATLTVIDGAKATAATPVGADGTQYLAHDGTGGTYTLTIPMINASTGQLVVKTTAPIRWNADAAAIGSALQALTDLTVGVQPVVGQANTFTVTFKDAQGNRLPVKLTADDTLLTRQAWQIKSHYTYYTVREEADTTSTTPSWHWNVYVESKSRGFIVDAILGLRSSLEWLAANPSLPAPDANFKALPEVDRILQEIDNLLKGQPVANTDQLRDDFESVAGKVGGAVQSLVGQLLSGQALSTSVLDTFVTTFAAALHTTKSTYLHYWIDNIDEGLRNWGEVGEALSRGIFDPQARRDLQNDAGASDGPDVVNTDMLNKRADAEDSVSHLDAVFTELDDANGDGETDDGFVNRYLLTMLGLPTEIGQLRAGIQSAVDQVDSKILEPAEQLLGDIDPIGPLVAFIKKSIKEKVESWVDAFIKDQFGIDLNLWEYLNNSPSAKLDIASITVPEVTLSLEGQPVTIQETEIPIFKPTDHDKLDQYLGFGDSDHHLPRKGEGLGATETTDTVTLTDGSVVDITLYGNPQGALNPDAEFDKQKFAAYANSVTLAKMLLLQETLPNGETPVGGKQPKTISKLLTDLTGQPYDFAQMTLTGDHGGDIMTATMPDVVNSYGQPVNITSQGPTTSYDRPLSGDFWLTLMDGDHMWRQDSQTATSSLYRYNNTTPPQTLDNNVQWRISGLAAGTYTVETDWLTDLFIADQGAKTPTRHATYSVYDGDGPNAVLVATLDQTKFPDDDVVGTDAWAKIGAVHIGSGTLRVVLSSTDPDNTGSGNDAKVPFVVAGRVRVVPQANPDAVIIISNQSLGYSESSGNLLSLAAPVSSNAPNGEDWATELDAAASGAEKIPATFLQQLLDQLKAISEAPVNDTHDALVQAVPDPTGAPPSKWIVTRIEAWHSNPLLTALGLSDDRGTFVRFRYAESYTVIRDPVTGKFDVSRNWGGIQYPTGTGNFTLWESSLLRDKVFRKLFVDWEDGGQQLQDLLFVV